MIILVACDSEDEPAPAVGTSYTLVDYDTLPGWEDDSLVEALPAWLRSCARLARLALDVEVGPGGVAGTAGDWRQICAAIANMTSADDAALRRLIEANLVPLHVQGVADGPGLFTGYYEPIIEAARSRDTEYTEPIYALPDDHVLVRLEDFDSHLKGHDIVGRVKNGRLIPYRRRGEIEAGAIKENAKVLFWARDALDVFILQVQGSGVVAQPNGKLSRIGFSGHNGHDYGSVGRALIERGELDAARAGWENIRAWLESNQEIMRETLALNPRFIFFQEIEGDGPTGAAGVTLTAERSMAVDPGHIPLNVPVWLDAEHPTQEKRLRQLMLAQDTGNAIRGAVRGDFFWGTGPNALNMAGRMKSRGAYYIFVPRSVAPAG